MAGEKSDGTRRTLVTDEKIDGIQMTLTTGEGRE